LSHKKINILSFDVEDGYQGFIKRGISGWENFKFSEEKNINIILKILSDKKVKATFFVLAKYAKTNPKIIKEIFNEGHEIASHGYSHQVLTLLSKEEFKTDVLKSKKILSDIIGEEIYGFRAPKWSLNEKTAWALRILAEADFKYDSSCFPSNFHEFGNSKYFNQPFIYFGDDFEIFEFPAQTIKIFGIQVPAAGGFYLRTLPYVISNRALRNSNEKNNYGMVYLHPFEFDVNPPIIKSGLAYRFVRYYNLDKTEKYFVRLLNDFNFSNIMNVIGSDLIKNFSRRHIL